MSHPARGSPRVPRETEYIVWQNRALRFYLAARLLWLHELYAAAAFCGQQTIELLLKGTLVYHDGTFRPKDAGHSWAKMLRTLGNKVPSGRSVEVPAYFYAGQRYQSTSRYPRQGTGLLVPTYFLADLDAAFARLVSLVPFQFNSELVQLLEKPRSTHARLLSRGNQQMTALRRAVRGWVRRRPAPRRRG